MKAVPVITEEAVQSLEEMIKTRVMEGRFDDIVRLRPDLPYDDRDGKLKTTYLRSGIRFVENSRPYAMLTPYQNK